MEARPPSTLDLKPKPQQFSPISDWVMGVGNEGFSTSFMVLKPEEAHFFNIWRLPISSNFTKPRFIHSSYAREHSFRHRLFIFLSILVQTFLRLSSTALAWFGFYLEKWLNLLSANGGFTGILLNILRMKLVIPDSSSAEYLSVFGHLDRRVQLSTNESTKRGDANYFGALCMMASKAAYENEAYVTKIVTSVWKMEFLGFFNLWNDYLEKYTTQAFMMRDKTTDYDTIVISFRGTEPFNADDWKSDFDISWYELGSIGKIHSGFMKALGLQKSVGWPKEIDRQDGRRPLAYYTLRGRLRKLVQENNRTKFIVTGHSLGGALAILFPFVLVYHEETLLLERLEGVYTFGQPRVGDRKFGEFMMKALSQYTIHYYRFVYGFDMVPRLPIKDKNFMFRQFGSCIYFDENYVAQVVEEEPFKNYLCIVGANMMRIHTCVEIGRSFLLWIAWPWRRGKEDEDTVFQRMVKLLGLVFPGILAHSPQYYVNSTRKGSRVLDFVV